MQSIEEFNVEFEQLDLSKISSNNKYAEDAERGVDGEQKVCNLLKTYSNEIYPSVVIWNKKHEFTTEIDFACVINDYLVLVETKEWYGKISPTGDNNVKLEYKNINGIQRSRIRTNPVYSVASFSKDLRKYLAPNAPGKDTQLIRMVVFTREEITLIEPLAKSKSIVCKLSEFESKLQGISSLKNENPYKLVKVLPTWDYYYNSHSGCWYKIVALNKTFTVDDKELSLSEIDSIFFEADNIAVVKLFNGEVLKGKANKKQLNYNSKVLDEVLSTTFIKFNKQLHEATPSPSSNIF